MARIRSLKPDFFKDEDLATLPFEARIWYEGLWCQADRAGRLEYRPKYLKNEIMPYDAVDAVKILDLLAAPGIPERPGKKFIRIYSVGEKQYIEIVNFHKHQNPHHTEKPSLFPCCPMASPNGNGGLPVKEPVLVGEEKDNIMVHGSLVIGHCSREGSIAQVGNGEPEEPKTPEPLNPLAAHAWEKVKAVYPKPDGVLRGEDEAAEEFVKQPAKWNQMLAAAKNLAASRRAQEGWGVPDIDTFVRGKWRDWQVPDKPRDEKQRAGPAPPEDRSALAEIEEREREVRG